MCDVRISEVSGTNSSPCRPPLAVVAAQHLPKAGEERATGEPWLQAHCPLARSMRPSDGAISSPCVTIEVFGGAYAAAAPADGACPAHGATPSHRSFVHVAARRSKTCASFVNRPRYEPPRMRSRSPPSKTAAACWYP